MPPSLIPPRPVSPVCTPTFTIRTATLELCPLALDDAPTLARIASREVADMMISVPHPMTPEIARNWIARERASMRNRSALVLGIRTAEGTGLLGVAGLRHIDHEHACAELTFWLAAEARGRGLATTAARAVVEHGFGELGLNRIEAYHMVRNEASGRVLARLGFSIEGTLRSRVIKQGEPHDVYLWSKLRTD